MELLEKEIYKRYQELIGVSIIKKKENPRTVKLADIINQYDAFCFDGYGTLYNRGDFIYRSAMDWFKTLRAAKKQLRLVTNAASNTNEVLAQEALARGFDFTAAETISSGSLLKEWLLQELNNPLSSVKESFKNEREVFYIGRLTGINVLEECGLKAVENPKSPVVAVSSNLATAEMYAKAVEILKRPNALLLVLNSDAWAPNIDGSRSLVSGALAEYLRRDSMNSKNKYCEVAYFGKPFSRIWEKVKASLLPNSRVLMIGDTLGTDVLGAYVAGFDSALVVGRNVLAKELKEDEDFLKLQPTYYLAEN